MQESVIRIELSLIIVWNELMLQCYNAEMLQHYNSNALNQGLSFKGIYSED